MNEPVWGCSILYNKLGKTVIGTSILVIISLILFLVIQPPTFSQDLIDSVKTTFENNNIKVQINEEPNDGETSFETAAPSQDSVETTISPNPISDIEGVADIQEETLEEETTIEQPQETETTIDQSTEEETIIEENEITEEVQETLSEETIPPQETEIPEEQEDNEITGGIVATTTTSSGSSSGSPKEEEYDLEIIDRNNNVVDRKTVKKGKHNEFIEPNNQKIKNLKIKGISFNNLEVNGKIRLGLDTAEISIPNIYVKKAFGIDPTGIKTDFIELTITADASSLYKCKDWDFKKGICNGNWEKIKDLTIGQDYTLRLDDKDPGFGEGENVTNCIGYLQNEDLYNLYNSPEDPCNKYKDFYVNKTGYQVSNQLNLTIAKQKQCFYFDGDEKCSNGENFTWEELTDNSTFVNITGTLNKPNYIHKIRYHLNQEDRRLLIHQGVKNNWKDIEEFAFGYIHYDIKLNNDTINDFIEVDSGKYNIDEDRNITSIVNKTFTLFDPFGGNKIIVDWLVNAEIRIKNRKVELYFGPVHFNKGDTKQVKIYWYDPQNPEYFLTRYVHDITDCTTLSCNKTGGTLKGSLFNNQNITLKNNRLYRITVKLQQIQFDAQGQLYGLTRDIGLGQFKIVNSSDGIFDFNSTNANDTHISDGGNYSDLLRTAYYNFSYITKPSSSHNATNVSTNLSMFGPPWPTNIPGSEEFTTAMYNQVNKSDNIRASTLANNTDIVHRFKFNLNETFWNIDEVFIRWEGLRTCNNVSLGVYNFGLGWVFLNSTISGGIPGDVNLTTTLKYAVHYVNDNNEIFIMARANGCIPNFHSLDTDFIEAKVVAKPTVIWNPTFGIQFNNISSTMFVNEHVNYSYVFAPNGDHGEFDLNFTTGDPQICGGTLALNHSGGPRPDTTTLTPCISILNIFILEPVPVINKIFTEPAKVKKSNSFNCQANVTDTSPDVGIEYVNFTIIDPNNTKLLDHKKGTSLGNNIWRSDNVTASISGIYNCTVDAYDNYTLVTGSIAFAVPEPKGVISTTQGAVPFYTINNNPQTCSGLKGGDECNLTWTVNATGDSGRIYNFFTIFDAIQYIAYVGQDNTTDVEVMIV